MDYFPIFLNLKQQSCLVVGGGDVATRKANSLIEAGASVSIVAPRINQEITRWVMQRKVTWRQGEFRADDLNGQRLVIAATSEASVNREVYRLAEERNILINTTDDLEACRFLMPAILDRSPLTIAISSAGHAPVLARLLRQKLETLIPSSYGKLAKFAGLQRDRVKSRLHSAAARRRFWEQILSGPVAEKIFNGQTDDASVLFDENLDAAATQHTPAGEVYLVGAGPGDPELLTLKALRLMQQSDVVLYDNLVSDAVLNLVRRDAVRISVAKKKGKHARSQEEINAELITLAQQGKRVCRLKGGDPFIFGRGGEELESLMANGIAFQVVPGISAANGCAAYAGIPLTHRDYADSVIYITGHRKNNGKLDLPFPALINDRQTIVFYMSLGNLPNIASQLQQQGMPPGMPVAAVEKGTRLDQRVVISTLNQIAGDVQIQGFSSPTLIIVGKVVKLATELHWFGDKALQMEQKENRLDPFVSGGQGPLDNRSTTRS